MKLVQISLIIAIIGILLLLSINILLDSKIIAIEEINNKLLNKNVKVRGEIFNIRSYEDSNFQVISIKDGTGKIDITLNKILNLTSENDIVVMGKVTEYNEYLQIKADKITF